MASFNIPELQAYHDVILAKKLASLQSTATERVKNLEGFEVNISPILYHRIKKYVITGVYNV